MSKVLFIMKYPLEEQYSVVSKFNGQMQALKNMGHEVSYLSFDRKHIYYNHNNDREIIQQTTLGNSKLYYHFLSFYDIYKAAKKIVETYDFDLVYFRYGPLNQMGKSLFKTVSKKAVLVVEIPTFPPDREKQKTELRRIYMKYSDKCWQNVSKYISLFTIIGEKANSYLGVPALNIDNGVSVESIPEKTITLAPDGKRHLLAVATMSNWQGYDRIIRGIANWDSPKAKEYVVDLVGGEGDGSLQKWKELSVKCNIDKQVLFHGRKTGDQLTKMFEMAEIGLGTLGMYRKKMNTGSVLKIREYMARGLPFIYANEDPDLEENMPWCIRVPNDKTPIDMELVDEFADSLVENKDIGHKMRLYALDHMSWEAQFRTIFSRIETLTGKVI